MELKHHQADLVGVHPNRRYIVCDTHPSFMPFVVRYQPIANSHASDDRVFLAVMSN
jgi:hypothetical protein